MPSGRASSPGTEERVVLDFEDFDGFLQQCSGRVSPAGIFIATSSPLPAGAEADIVLKLGDAFTLLESRGEVIWNREFSLSPQQPAGMSLRFLELDPESQKLLTRLVEHHERSGGEAFDPHARRHGEAPEQPAAVGTAAGEVASEAADEAAGATGAGIATEAGSRSSRERAEPPAPGAPASAVTAPPRTIKPAGVSRTGAAPAGSIYRSAVAQKERLPAVPIMAVGVAALVLLVVTWFLVARGRDPEPGTGGVEIAERGAGPSRQAPATDPGGGAEETDPPSVAEAPQGVTEAADEPRAAAEEVRAPSPGAAEPAADEPAGLAPPALPPAAAGERARRLVERWAAAWSGQRVDDYLSFYSSRYRPGGTGLEEWRRQRRQRIEGPRFIEVSVEDFEVVEAGPRRATVRFRQRYRSDTFQDEVVKSLELANEEDGWKIISEKSES